ncbi:MAG: hypothetical protein ACYTG0_41175 [Planctomycetota bacterium]
MWFSPLGAKSLDLVPTGRMAWMWFLPWIWFPDGKLVTSGWPARRLVA